MSEPLLAIRGVSKTFRLGNHVIKALQDVSLDVHAGQCLAIVGESGSGKSTLANLVLGIYSLSAGEILFADKLLPNRRTLYHRRHIQLVQQNPLSSLNPKLSVGKSIRLALDVHNIGDRKGRGALVEQLLSEVGLTPEFVHRRPDALSGGQRQRVSIARALACQPELLVLDEPTSALDVLVQAQVLRLLDELRPRRGLTYMFITHDLSVVRNIADSVAVFESGRLIEADQTEVIFSNPSHSYTRRLVGAVPVVTEAEVQLRQALTSNEHEGISN